MGNGIDTTETSWKNTSPKGCTIKRREGRGRCVEALSYERERLCRESVDNYTASKILVHEVLLLPETNQVGQQPAYKLATSSILQ